MTKCHFDEWWNELMGFSIRSEYFMNETKHMDVSDKNIKRLVEWIEAAYEAGYNKGHYICYHTYSSEEE